MCHKFHMVRQRNEETIFISLFYFPRMNNSTTQSGQLECQTQRSLTKKEINSHNLHNKSRSTSPNIFFETLSPSQKCQNRKNYCLQQIARFLISCIKIWVNISLVSSKHFINVPLRWAHSPSNIQLRAQRGFD